MQLRPLRTGHAGGDERIGRHRNRFDFVYWADSDAGTINKVSKSLTRQGTPTPVVSGPAAQNVQGIASDGMFVYWTNKTASGQVRRALPTGAALTTIATNQAEPDWIASNGTTCVWTDQTGNQIMSAPANSDGGVPAVQLNVSGENGTTPAGIAIDGANAYYASKTAGGGLAESVPLAGGPVSEIGTGTFVGIAIDSTYVYWTGGSANPSVYENIKAGTVATERTMRPVPSPARSPWSPTGSPSLSRSGHGGLSSSGKHQGALYRVPNRKSRTAASAAGQRPRRSSGNRGGYTAVYWGDRVGRRQRDQAREVIRSEPTGSSHGTAAERRPCLPGPQRRPLPLSCSASAAARDRSGADAGSRDAHEHVSENELRLSRSTRSTGQPAPPAAGRSFVRHVVDVAGPREP